MTSQVKLEIKKAKLIGYKDSRWYIIWHTGRGYIGRRDDVMYLWKNLPLHKTCGTSNFWNTYQEANIAVLDYYNKHDIHEFIIEKEFTV